MDYLAVYPLMDRLRLSEDDWDDLLCDLRVLEDEALAAMHESDE